MAFCIYMKIGQSIYVYPDGAIESPDRGNVSPGLKRGALSPVRLTLRQKRGREISFIVDQPEAASVDTEAPGGVKLAAGA